MKKLFKYIRLAQYKYTLPALALCALAACTDDDNVSAPTDPYNGKELISFGGDGSGITRASLTRADDPDPYATETGFTSETKIVMRIKAENAASSPTANSLLSGCGNS